MVSVGDKVTRGVVGDDSGKERESPRGERRKIQRYSTCRVGSEISMGDTRYSQNSKKWEKERVGVIEGEREGDSNGEMVGERLRESLESRKLRRRRMSSGLEGMLDGKEEWTGCGQHFSVVVVVVDMFLKMRGSPNRKGNVL